MFSGIRIGALSDTRKNGIYAVLPIFLLPLLVNLPSLLEWWSVDPIHFVSGLPSFFQGRQMLRGWPWIDPSGGFISQAIGKLAADEWLSGRIPWWNYYSGVGRPLAAEMQPGALFLPFVLLNHFSNGLLYIEVIIQILAGLGTYLLLRKIGFIRLAALTGAVLNEFSGAFVWLGQTPVINPIAFLPWLIFGIECAREKSLKRSFGGAWIIGASLAFSIYAGFPETAYINGLLAAVWSCWRIFSVPSGIRLPFIRKLVTGVMVGLLLSMPIIIPFLEYLSHSYLGGHTFSGGFSGLRTEAIPQLFFPWLYGIPWTYYMDDANVAMAIWGPVGGYFSAAQLSVIALGLLMTRKSGLFIVLLLWVLICLGRTFALPFITMLVDLVPLLKLVVFYRYSAPSWEFCTALLCAKVIHDVSSANSHSRPKFIVGLVMALLIAAFSLYPARGLIGSLYAREGYLAFLSLSLAWGFGSMLAVALSLWLAKHRPMIAARAAAAILVADAIALFCIPSFSGVIGARSRSAGIDYLKQHIGINRFYTLGPIAPNYGAYYGIASINHNALPIPANWVKYVSEHIDPYSHPMFFTGNFPRDNPKAPTQAQVLRENRVEYERIGVRYIVSPHSQDPFERTAGLAVLDSGNEPFKRVFESSDMDIYELSGARPYFDIINGDCDLKIESRSIVSVNCRSEAELVRRELYYPGWEAFVGRKKLHIEAYNDIFQAIRIPPGQYKIVFIFTPTHIRLITASFLLGLFWLITGAIRSHTANVA